MDMQGIILIGLVAAVYECAIVKLNSNLNKTKYTLKEWKDNTFKLVSIIQNMKPFCCCCCCCYIYLSTDIFIVKMLCKYFFNRIKTLPATYSSCVLYFSYWYCYSLLFFFFFVFCALVLVTCNIRIL